MAVYQRHEKAPWMFDFMRKGVRYRKGGYATKEDAKDAQAKARANVKRINTDFMKLSKSRLDELELRRTNDHYERNNLLIDKLIEEYGWGLKKTITREDVEKVLADTAKFSKDKANKELVLIKALFNHGIERNWIDVNPTRGIKPFGLEKEPKYIPSAEDIQKVLAVATDEQRNYLLAIIHTMARVKEINQLKWSDVYEGYLILRTKKAKNSQVSTRAIPLTATLKKILETLPRKSEYVFTSPVTKKGYRTRHGMIRSLCEKAGVRYFAFHNLRHWGASKLAEELVPLSDIQKLLGHTKATTTDIYIQSIKPTLIGAIEKLDSQH